VSTEPEGAKAQSHVITSEEIDVTVQQKNSELGKSYLHEKTNFQRKCKFHRSWLDQMSWLLYDSETNIAKCNTCSLFPDLSDWSSKIVEGFTGPFKVRSFKKHETSNQHIKCDNALKGK
jgi:hypothetical protein